MKVSIIIRTYNEERYLGDVLKEIEAQDLGPYSKEVVIVDSGSEDQTRDIANSYGCRIVNIKKEEFTFGRSLNFGCAAAKGEYLAILSGHCIPATDSWLKNLIDPLHKKQCVYSYGRQIGNENSKFSEKQLFKKYFPAVSSMPQDGFFCNNANSALTRQVWEINHFDEELTGLEDMELAKRLIGRGYKIGYAADAPVFHLHEEGWRVVHRRYEREAIALQIIMPEVKVSIVDFFRYFISSVLLDMGAALEERTLTRNFLDIITFRFMQFSGAYQGNHETRQLSSSMREKYFYPK